MCEFVVAAPGATAAAHDEEGKESVRVAAPVRRGVYIQSVHCEEVEIPKGFFFRQHLEV